MKASLGALALGLILCGPGTAQSTTGQTSPDSPAPPAQQNPQAPAPAQPAAPTSSPLPSPAMTGPITNLPPLTFDAGPFKTLSLNGVLSGMGFVQSSHVPGDQEGNGSLTNGQLILQKADGVLQFYLQAGAYQIPALGTAFISTGDSVNDLFGPVPEGYINLAGKNTSLQIGALPTLIGAEYTFSFENMNIERGLLGNQEPSISKGIQLNQALGKWAFSLSWNDGFYSNRYSWLSGSAAYTKGAHAISFVAGGNYNHTAYTTYATPVQNNSSIYNIIYAYTKGSIVIAPYLQYSDVPANSKTGIGAGAHTDGGAILASKTLTKGWSVAARFEDIVSSGSVGGGAVSLLYGPGSSAYSFTVTPTYQKGGFFGRGEASWVHINDFVPGDGFGTDGSSRNQVRAMVELGFLFGDNIERAKP